MNKEKEVEGQIKILLTGKSYLFGSYLLGSWGDKKWEVRCKAARALGKIGDPIAISSLINTCTHGYDIAEQLTEECIMKAVKKIVSKNSISNLIKGLNESNYRFSDYSCNSGTIPQNNLHHELCNKNINSSEIPVLINVLEDDNRYIKDVVIDLLERSGDLRAVPALINILEDSDHECTKKNAICALGKFGDIRGVSALTKALRDSNYEVKCSAISALEKIGDSKPVHDLIDIFKKSDANMQKKIISALGIIGDSKSIPFLLNTFEKSDTNIQRSIIVALGEIRHLKPVPFLLNIFEKSDTDTQKSIVFALGRIGDPKSINTLLSALRSERLRSEAVEALGKIGNPNTLEAIEYIMKNDRDEYVREKAFQAALKIRSFGGE